MHVYCSITRTIDQVAFKPIGVTRGHRLKQRRIPLEREPEYTKCYRGGRVTLHGQLEYPQYIKELYKDAHFMHNIRAYNQMFSMTSLGANVDNSINNGKGPYVFRVSRQIYHWIGSMCPDEGVAPRNSQASDFDLIVEEHSRFPQRVHKLHPCYMSLQFPLLFVYGEEGYHKGLKLTNVHGVSAKGKGQMSMNMYYSYQIHDRLNHYSLLPKGEKLFQQYVVTAYCAIEQERLDYIRKKQSEIRNEYLSGLYDAIMRGDRDGSDLGTRLVLTASFTCGPRYMYSHYLDALAICRVHGNPSFFITFTCNANWPEIQEYMDALPELTPAPSLNATFSSSNIRRPPFSISILTSEVIRERDSSDLVQQDPLDSYMDETNAFKNRLDKVEFRLRSFGVSFRISVAFGMGPEDIHRQ
ncbi:DNA helicase [Tanacetum coccineum]